MAKRQPKRSTRLQSSAPTQKISTGMWFAISAVVAVIIVAGLFYLGNRGGASNSSNIEGVEFLAEAGRGHVEGEVAYPDAVPSGGQHNPVWQNCGIYDEPLRPENAIHSLEHGAVWVAYQPNLPADQVELLREAVRQARRNFGQSMVLLSPQPDLTTPIELVAWRVRLRVEQAADGRIAEFLATYQKGPFTPEPAASCINGIGTPLE